MNEITSLGQTHVHEYFFPTVAGHTYAKYYWTGSAWETDYMHGNPLGSSQIVMRSDNSYGEAEVLFPFGGLKWRGSGSGTQDVRFAGMQERDLETETWQDTLDPTPNRTYTSGLGRWFSPDPLAGDITNPQSLNRYAYVLNNPTTLTDPSGLGDCPPGTHQIGPGQCESDFTGADQLALVGPGWDEFGLLELPTFTAVYQGQVEVRPPVGPEGEVYDAPVYDVWNIYVQFGLVLPPNSASGSDVPVGMDIWHCAGCPRLWHSAESWGKAAAVGTAAVIAVPTAVFNGPGVAAAGWQAVGGTTGAAVLGTQALIGVNAAAANAPAPGPPWTVSGAAYWIAWLLLD